MRPELEPLLTAQGVAQLFGVPVSWVYAKAEAGELPSFKLGHYRRFRAKEIEEHLEAHRQGRRREAGESLHSTRFMAGSPEFIEERLRRSNSDPGPESRQ